MDVQTAFFYGLIDQLIYVELPPGYKKEGIVCKLCKALYGLKQAPRLWYERLSTYLIEKLGLQRLHADHGIFAITQGIEEPLISLWVDDLNLFTPAGSSWMKRMKDELSAGFKMVDMGPVQFYLGLKVDRDRVKRTIKLSQPAYIEKMLHKFHLQEAKTAKILMTEGGLFANEGQTTAKEINDYQEMVGSLMFAMLETRADIAFATSMVSRFAQNPSRSHIKAVKNIFRYLSSSQTRGITFGGEGGDLTIIGYSDSDWAGDVVGRKSTSGFIFMMNNGPVSWCAKKQSTVALSSTEAEYIALTLAAKEATWLRLLMTELGLLGIDNQLTKIALRGDNQSSIALANNPVLHQRSKHIDIQHHYIRDEVDAKRIELSYIPTEEMIADGLTKPLSAIKYLTFVKQMGMSETDSPDLAAPARR